MKPLWPIFALTACAAAPSGCAGSPTDAAFDTGEVPLNLHARNIVWVPTGGAADGPSVAHLWGAPGEGKASGFMVQWPAGSTVNLSGADLRAVIVDGRAGLPDRVDETLAPGSGVRADNTMQLGCSGDVPCRVFVGATGALAVRGVTGN